MSMAVSGPAQYSQRTDQPIQSLPDAGYGEQQAFHDQQAGAPMAAAPPVPLTAPTQRPNEPITAGAPFGAGPGPVPNGPNLTAETSAIAKHLPLLEPLANSSDVSPSFRLFVRYLKTFGQ